MQYNIRQWMTTYGKFANIAFESAMQCALPFVCDNANADGQIMISNRLNTVVVIRNVKLRDDSSGVRLARVIGESILHEDMTGSVRVFRVRADRTVKLLAWYNVERGNVAQKACSVVDKRYKQ